MLLAAIVFIGSVLLSLVMGVSMTSVVQNFNFSVIVILVVMELFTNLIVETGVMQLVATKMALLSGGNKRKCLFLFGLIMFLTSAFVNNITAVMMVVPIVFIFLKALNADRKYIVVFLSVILALSNTGGASSPIGDFPAIVIMSSGVIGFTEYLFRAFPLFLCTSLVLLTFWSMFVKRRSRSDTDEVAVVKSLQDKKVRVRYDVLIPLGVVLLGMFVAWSVIPQDVCPPAVIAVIGYCISIVLAVFKGVRIKHMMDMKSVLTIASFLFLAAVISASGVLAQLVTVLATNVPDPKMLLIVIMLLTSLVAGVFSAGPAAAAMLPIVIDLCNTTFAAQSGWVVIAYAASICAGSSLFLWSATAGFILSGKVDRAHLMSDNHRIRWGIKEYFSYGILNYVIQMGMAVAWIAIVL